MSLWWALPVLVLVAGSTIAALAVGRLSTELDRLQLALRRAGRVGVAVDDLSQDVEFLGRRLARLHGRQAVDGSPAPGPIGPAR